MNHICGVPTCQSSSDIIIVIIDDVASVTTAIAVACAGPGFQAESVTSRRTLTHTSHSEQGTSRGHPRLEDRFNLQAFETPASRSSSQRRVSTG